ncbi:hypothetical protein [Microbulbifer mangrovi]|uniref:hypothetical protein n=1 Tax=Microbulbifer mangrovi TaxID=927787 RepID=UPI0009907C74|nr:hypothetical protein [Microbulbifer mangrovi]
MSWDISIIKFSRDYSSIEEIPDDEVPLNLGERSFVHESVLEFFPKTNWSDPAWGIYDCEFGSIGFNVGDKEIAEGMMLHVRASDEIVKPIIAMCLKNGWSGLDTGSGDFIEKADDPTSGINSWREYRDQVLKK